MSQPDEILKPSQVGSELMDAWDDLADSTGGSYFQTGTWAMAWWEHLAHRVDTRIATWRGPGNTLAAVCALSRVRRPLLAGAGPSVSVWTITGSGAGAGDHLGWPTLDARQDDVLDWIVETCEGRVILSNIASNRTAGLANRGFDLIDTTPTLAAPLGTGDAWFPGTKDFRKKLRYYGRQLEKSEVHIELVDSTGIDAALFERLLDLHAARSDHMGWGTHFDEQRMGFHLNLISRARSDRGPAMCVARRGEEVVGVLYGFRFGSSFSYFQTGWSREFVKQSLGSVLVARTMEWAADHGAGVFDFLRGDDEYKRRFGAEPRIDTTWMLSRGAAGKALRAREAVSTRRRRAS